jgi:hypothetical protein
MWLAFKDLERQKKAVLPRSKHTRKISSRFAIILIQSRDDNIFVPDQRIYSLIVIMWSLLCGRKYASLLCGLL